MTSYGFRLFRVGLREARGRKPKPFTAEIDRQSWAYREHFHALLQGQNGLRAVGLPRRAAPEVDEAAVEAVDEADGRPDPIFGVESVGNRGVHTTFVVRYGRDSGFDRALASPELGDSEDVDIAGLAPSRSYRGALILPESGTVGVLAVETISRACPVQPIVKWTARWSEACAEAASQRGMPARWWKLSATALGDDEQRQRYLKSASAQRLKFVRKNVAAGRTPDSEDLELVVNCLQPRVRGQAQKAVRSWFARSRDKDDRVNAGEEARALAALIGAEDLEFDDVTVQLDDGSATKSFTPHDFPDVFTYPLAEDVSPVADTFYGGIRGAVQRIAPAAELPRFDWHGWPPGR